MEIIEIKNSVFKKFETSHKYSNFLHALEMEEVTKNNGGSTFYLGFYEKKKLVGACRMLSYTNRLGKKMFYAIRGPLLDYSNIELVTDVMNSLKDYLKKENGYLFKMDPTVIYQERDIDGNVVENGENNFELFNKLKSLGFKHQGFNTGHDSSKQNRYEFITDIKGKTKEEVFNGLRSSHRNKINKTKNFGISVEEVGYDELADYNKIVNDTANLKGFYSRGLDYFQSLYNIYKDSGNCKFIVAYLYPKEYCKNLKEQIKTAKGAYEKKLNSKSSEGAIREAKNNLDSLESRLEEFKDRKEKKIPLSAGQFIIHNKTVNYLAGGSYREYMNLYAMYAIQWYMFEYAIDHNLDTYNFLGIIGNFDKNDPDYGVYDFKKGFGGKVVEYIGEFQLPLSSYYYVFKFKNKLRKIIKK